MKYKIFEIQSNWVEMKWTLPINLNIPENAVLLLEVFGVFDETDFDSFESAAATLNRHTLNGRRFTILPVFE